MFCASFFLPWLGQWIEHLSWEPRASVYHGFLSHEECDYLIQKATPKLTESEVVDNGSGKGKHSE